MNDKRKSNTENQFDGVMSEAANLGAERMVEFLSSSRGIGNEAWQRLREQAQVGCVAVATKVRYEAAINNRHALERQRALLPGRGEDA